MESIFSPTRTVTTNMSENTPVQNTARALFKEPDMHVPPAPALAPVSAPLSTITNTQTNIMTMPSPEEAEAEAQEKALSPSLQNVSQLKKAFAKMEKENKQKLDSAWKKRIPMPTNGKSSSKGRVRPSGANRRQAFGKVHEIREKIAEGKLISSITQTPIPGSRRVKIPMNKVQEMRNILLDFQQNQAKQKELIHMSSKKRAKIVERLNKVQDIHRWLNEMEQQSKKNGAGAGTVSSGPKTKELNLPMNRVNEMKNWLIEFERQNKQHSNRFATKTTSISSHQGGGYIPVTRKRQNVNGEESQRQVGLGTDTRTNARTYDPSTPDVSNLAQFLIDFEQKNKEHYERSQKKGSGIVGVQSKSNAKINDTFDGFADEQSNDASECEVNVEHIQEEEHQNTEDEIYEDHSVKEQDHNEEEEAKEEEHVKEGCNKAERNTKEEDVNVDDSGEDEDVDGENDELENIGKDDETTENLLFENTSILDGEAIQNDVNTSMLPTANNMDQSEWEDDYEDLMRVDVNIEPVQSTESWESATFSSTENSEDGRAKVEENSNGEQLSDGDGYGFDRDEEEIDPDDGKDDEWNHFADDGGFDSMIDNSNMLSLKNDDVEDTVDEVAFESDALSHEEILSTSHAGPRFSTSFMLPPDQASFRVQSHETCACRSNDSKIQSKGKSTKGFGCVYKSIFKIFKKRELRIEEESNDKGIGMEQYLLATKGDHKKSFHTSPVNVPESDVEKSCNLHTASHSSPSARTGGYLPNAYNSRDDEPQDFAREMVLGRSYYQFDPSNESPISLASAFRRTMSPTTSSSADSELSSVHALISLNPSNVAQHVGWLQEHFQSPKVVGKTKSSEGMKL